FVAVTVLEEDAIATADGPFSVSARIPGKTDTRSGIHQFVLEAAASNASGAALDETVEEVAGGGIEELRVVDVKAEKLWSVAGDPLGGAEAKFLVEFFLVAAEEAPAKAEVEGKFFGDAPVVLEIRFEDFVAVVEEALGADLGITA